MASALMIFFLGCWLAGQSGVSGELRYPKPSISLSPNGGVTLGGAVTIRCRGRHQNMRFLLYKDGNQNMLQDAEPTEDVAEFPIRNVSRRDAGSYSCYYHHKRYQFRWSHPSDPVELVVAGGTDLQWRWKLAPTHTGSVEPGTESWGRKSPSTSPETGRTDLQWRWKLAPTRTGRTGPGTESWGRKSPSTSPETGINYPIQSGMTTAPTRPGSVMPGGSDSSAAPVPTRTIITGVSTAAAGLLLCLLAFVCYRRTGGRKGPAPRQSSRFGVLKTPAQEDPVYASIDEGKEMQTLEPNCNTYAELDRQTLQPSVYAAINVSQGAPQ